jgi:delta 1-pyrroline-5-carboxylate dehydrogenase
LPGPTGESNSLLIVPRGGSACIASDEPERAQQGRAGAERSARIAWSTTRCDDRRMPYCSRARTTRPRACAAAARPGRTAGSLVVARDGDVRRHAARDERTLTVNTTASGGNASLLSLEEEEPA